jgi:hypothetical protein
MPMRVMRPAFSGVVRRGENLIMKDARKTHRIA